MTPLYKFYEQNKLRGLTIYKVDTESCKKDEMSIVVGDVVMRRSTKYVRLANTKMPQPCLDGLEDIVLYSQLTTVNNVYLITHYYSSSSQTLSESDHR